MLIFRYVIEVCDKEVVVFNVLCGLFEIEEGSDLGLIGGVIHVESDGVVFGLALDGDVFHVCIS